MKKVLSVFIAIIMLLTASPLSGFVGLELPRLTASAEDSDHSETSIDGKLSGYLGDVNYDQKLTAVDARIILRYATKLDVIPDEYIHLADINGDGNITAVDARIALRMSTKLESLFEYGGSYHSHEYVTTNFVKVTCENDGIKTQKCNVCGKEKTEYTAALGHSYVEVTCLAPKKCTRCGETFGKALGHKFVNATCYSPAKCTLCGMTSGGAKNHDFSTGVCSCGLSVEKVTPVLYTFIDALGVHDAVSKILSDCLDKDDYGNYIGYIHALYIDDGGVFKDSIAAFANIPDFAKAKSYLQTASDIMTKEMSTHRRSDGNYTASMRVASSILNKDIEARENILLAVEEILNFIKKYDKYF